MKIYNYHPESGEFISESIADESPLEPGVWLIPAHATTLVPLKPKTGYAVIFANGGWNYEEDHRGEIWWDEFGNPIQIRELGKPIDTLTNVEPATSSISDLTSEEKLASIGLTIDDLKKLLGIK